MLEKLKGILLITNMKFIETTKTKGCSPMKYYPISFTFSFFKRVYDTRMFRIYFARRKKITGYRNYKGFYYDTLIDILFFI